MKDYESAAQDYLQILDEVEDQTVIEENLATMYMEMEEYKEAETWYKALLEEAPGNTFYARQLADICYHFERFEEAITYYSKCLPTEGDAVGFGNRGDCYWKTGDPDKAIEDLDKAIELDPEYGWAYYVRGSIYMEMEEYAKAEEDLANAQKYTEEQQ